jgi:hypothetical protein
VLTTAALGSGLAWALHTDFTGRRACEARGYVPAGFVVLTCRPPWNPETPFDFPEHQRGRDAFRRDPTTTTPTWDPR